MTSEKTAIRRRYSKELKAQVLAECAVPGTSVAKVAMAHGINANVVHGWRKLAREEAGVMVGQPVEFVPVRLDAALPMAAQPGRHIEVELRRGAVTMKLNWPLSAAADFAAWARELLR
ncbi:MAG: transposase [Rubrivivax sp.]